MHQLLNTTLNQIVKALDKEGVPSVLLKGQGVAQNYRKPTNRMKCISYSETLRTEPQGQDARPL